jgi:hypothetical protein
LATDTPGALRWPLLPTQVCVALCWLLLALPWLSGILTIPWDAKAHFHPQLQALANALHAGQSPFWTPNIFAGHPQIADPQSLVFSPLHLLLAAVNPAPSLAAGDAVLFGLLLMGMMALVVMFKDRDWHPAGAIVSALAFGFGVAASWRIQHVGQVMSLAYLAIALMLLSRMLERSSKGYALAFGLSAGLMVLGRDQVALLGIYLLTAFVLAYWASARPFWRGVRSSIWPMAIAGLIILVVAGVPSAFTALLAEGSNRPSTSFIDAGKGSLHPSALLTILIANLFGAAGPLVNHWGAPSPIWGPVDLYLARNMSVVYAGALPALALLYAGFIRGQAWRTEIRFFIVALCLATLYALGRYTPAFALIFEWIPGVNLYRRPADAVFIMGLLLAITGGYCVHVVATAKLVAAKIWQPLLNGIIMLGCLGAAAWIAYAKGVFNLAMQPLAIAAASLALAGAVLLLLPLLRGKHMVFATALVSATMTMDLAVSNGPSESTALPTETYEILTPASTNETIATIRKLLAMNEAPDRRDRIELAGVGFHWPNASMVHGLDNTLGYNPLRLKLYSIATGAEDHVALPDQRRFSALMPGYRSLLADMLGLRYIVTGIAAEEIDKSLRPGDLALVARTSDAFIYENRSALPRVLLVPDALNANFDAILKSGKWPEFDPRRTVLLAGSGTTPLASDTSVAPRPARAGSAPSFARIVSYGTTQVTVSTITATPGYLVLNDVWHPWWTVTVNGAPAPLMQANVLFRAVAIPAGTSTVVFQFAPFAGLFQAISQRLKSADSN